MRHVLLAVLTAMLLSGCGGEAATPPPAEPTDEPAPPPTTEEPDVVEDEATEEADEVACGEVETIPVQGGEHLIEDQEPPVPYNSTPPTSGWHTSGTFEIDVFDEPLSEPEQVSILEAGAAVVSYHDLDESDREALEALVRSEYDGRAAVTPYEELDAGEVALTAWGTLQRCDGLDLDVVAAFVDAHAEEEPDTPGHRH